MIDRQPAAWQTCHVGSCQRHQECMYRPCRTRPASPTPMTDKQPAACPSDGEVYSSASFGGDAEAKRAFVESTRPTRPAPGDVEAVARDDETYEIGKRDGYESAVQDIDQLTGGDGEYFGSTMGDGVDMPVMKARILERFTAMAERDRALREAVQRFLPKGVDINNPNVPRSTVIPLDVTIGELRDLAILASTGDAA